ncbi:hypothetical protein PHLCEN_2v9572 [Hermanssonia centrifuga]|uniref:Uncharacterized protein n=1 Tax=Hermanssonia centrifuga TaxID=98765 RepID=A0A2R6NQF0_9APHY|nr:hypothetical protein PHLCEN_2v9572 [Hermanssonia centrifuga]
MASVEDSSEDVSGDKSVRMNRTRGKRRGMLSRRVCTLQYGVLTYAVFIFWTHPRPTILSSTAESEYSMAPSQTYSRVQSLYPNDLQGYVIGAKTWIGN